MKLECGFMSYFTSGRAEILSTAVGYVSDICTTHPKKCLDVIKIKPMIMINTSFATKTVHSNDRREFELRVFLTQKPLQVIIAVPKS